MPRLNPFIRNFTRIGTLFPVSNHICSIDQSAEQNWNKVKCDESKSEKWQVVTRSGEEKLTKELVQIRQFKRR